MKQYNKIKKIIVTTALLAFIGWSTTFAQVGIGTTTPHASAALDVESTTKGFLPPRLSSAERDAIASPTQGLTIFNTTTNAIEFSDGTDWVNLNDNSTVAVNGATAPTGNGDVGIGTETPDANAALDVESTTKGFLPPRMTDAQRNAIASPAEGLTIFNTTVNCLQWFNGSGWYNACDGSVDLMGGGFTNGFEDNTTCATKVISVTSCASVTGATLNDDTTTADGTEYDWSGATGFVDGGTTRALVEIGGQCWYSRNAVNIPSAYDPAPAWANNSDVGWSGDYTGGPFSDEGKLYQWSAAMNGDSTERAQGVCPTGWHVPSDCEWMYLENTLGMSTDDQVLTGVWRASGNVGGKLSTLTRATPASANGSGTNSSGFTALLAGFRGTSGTFHVRGTHGYWWSSSESSATNAQRRFLFSSQAGVYRNSLSKASGFSVRCLKD